MTKQGDSALTFLRFIHIGKPRPEHIGMYGLCQVKLRQTNFIYMYSQNLVENHKEII